MKKFLDLITEHLQDAFEASGYPKEGITASLSNRPDLCEYQCNGAMVLAKKVHQAPMEIAEKVVGVLLNNPAFEMAEAVKPGFINLKVTGSFLTDYIAIPPNADFSNLNETDITILNDKASNFIANSVELKMEDKKKRYVIIIRNVTDQKELENLKEDFVATLTHDLKVPIIAETNMLDLFLNGSFGNVNEKQGIALKNMQASNRELLDLVQIVLDTYKFRSQTIRLYRENIMLKGFIEEIITEMTPIADKTKNDFQFNLPRDIRVLADRIQLKRIIKNIIQNAISYGKPNSPIEITIGEIPKYVTIKVKDYGKGIAQADINKIFNKYYSAAKKFRKIGTGLGLYLSFQIAKAHGGDLTVESVESEYTEFCIKLPAGSSDNMYYGE